MCPEAFAENNNMRMVLASLGCLRNATSCYFRYSTVYLLYNLELDIANIIILTLQTTQAPQTKHMNLSRTSSRYMFNVYPKKKCSLNQIHWNVKRNCLTAEWRAVRGFRCAVAQMNVCGSRDFSAVNNRIKCLLSMEVRICVCATGNLCQIALRKIKFGLLQERVTGRQADTIILIQAVCTRIFSLICCGFVHFSTCRWCLFCVRAHLCHNTQRENPSKCIVTLRTIMYGLGFYGKVPCTPGNKLVFQ